MHVFISKALYRMQERLLGRPTFRRLGELDQAQWRSPDELRSRQNAHLRALLLHARAHVPFHRRSLEDAGADPARDDPIDVLARIPTVTRDDVHEHLADMLWVDAPGGLRASSTGGSTGQPLQFFIDREREACDQAARALTRSWYGVRVGEPELWLWGSPIETGRLDRCRKLRDRALNQRLVRAFDLSRWTMREYHMQLSRIRPTCIVGYPSTLARWAEFLRSEAISIGVRPACKAVFVTGEVCDDRQRALIGDFFASPVADGYGSREAGFIAHECPAGRRHVISEHVLVETLDEQNRTTPLGVAGEVAITHLCGRGMPLIRYRTGDIATLLAGRCACGRGFPLMSPVTGRRTDLIRLPDGTEMHGLSVIYPLRELPALAEYQVVQQADLSLDVAVVARPMSDPTLLCHDIRQRLDRTLRGQAAVRVKAVSHIARAGSGKHRPVISHADAPPRTGIRPSGDHA